MKKILIITGNKYPNEDPGAVRQHVFAKIFAQCGYEPIVIGMGKTTYFKEKCYDGIKYYSLRCPYSSLFFRVLGRFLFSWNLRYILHQFESEKVEAILFVSGNRNTFSFVKKIAIKNRITLLHDSVEWYSPCEFSNGEKDRAYRYNNELNSKLIDKNYRVIAISTYLEKHFLKRGIETIRIPVILDVKEMPCSYKTIATKRTILYAGNMAGKDQIQEFISAITSLPNEIKNQFEFKIFGVTYEQFRKKYGNIDSEALDSIILFYGKVPRDRVKFELKNADFTVLMRPSGERYAKAGFPTKVVESLASGTPVICNFTSDLNLYLKDNVNSIIINECSKKECIRKLMDISLMTDSQIQEMKKSARKTAENNFDWRLYVNKVGEILELI